MSNAIWLALFNASLETIYMVFTASLLAVLLGLPLGIYLVLSRHDGLLANPYWHQSLSFITNVTRSIPFIILLIALIPFTRLLIGTSIGTSAAIVPLAIGAIPFFARLVESALLDVPSGLTEAGLAMGAKPWQIVRAIYLPEALPNIINGITVTSIALVGYSAMAGAVGGGGLGDLAIRYGYQRFNVSVMLITIILLVMFVQCLQWLGDKASRYFLHH